MRAEARRAVELPRITRHGEGAALAVRVQPRAKRNAVVGVRGEALKIALTAPPVEGAANKALRKLLGKLLGVPPTSIEIVRGAAGRDKSVAFKTLNPAALEAKLVRMLAT